MSRWIFRQFVRGIAFMTHRGQVAKVDGIERIDVLRKEVIICFALSMVAAFDVTITTVRTYLFFVFDTKGIVVRVDVTDTAPYGTQMDDIGEQTLAEFLQGFL